MLRLAARLVVRPIPVHSRLPCRPVDTLSILQRESIRSPTRKLWTSSANYKGRAWRPFTKQGGSSWTIGRIWRAFSNQTGAKKEGILAMYSRLLIEKPILTKTISSGFIVAIGDIIAQSLFEGALQDGKGFDLLRMARMWVIGAFVVAPCLHYWYRFLNRIIPDPSTIGAIKRVLLDQGLFAPTFICVFFGAMFTLEGRLNELPDHLRRTWWPALQANWKLWIPAMLITFRFIPHHFQVIWVNTVALIWNTYLSWAGHQEHAHLEVQPPKEGVRNH